MSLIIVIEDVIFEHLYPLEDPNLKDKVEKKLDMRVCLKMRYISNKEEEGSHNSHHFKTFILNDIDRSKKSLRRHIKDQTDSWGLFDLDAENLSKYVLYQADR